MTPSNDIDGPRFCGCGCGELLPTDASKRTRYLTPHRMRRGGAAAWGPNGWMRAYPGETRRLEAKRARNRRFRAKRKAGGNG